MGQSANSINPSGHGRALAMEPLEPRVVLSAAGLVDVGAQPEGGLSGKIVYLHAGHGYTADNLGSGAWTTQRPLLLGMVEDLGNKDQMDFLADYLFRAGATIAPLRPIGHQPNEVVLDNDDPEVTFHGDWSDSSSGVYFGGPGDVPYRYASTAISESAYARYRPMISEAGFYPVYTWVRYGSDRAPDQLYRVHHSGGTTEVTINHRRVGNGPVYLGTYYFEAGTDGYVDISNASSSTGDVVIADMIRFGNGRGDINRGGGVSGLDREDEAGLYWVQWHVDRSQGIPDSEYRTNSSDRTATVSLSPRFAEYMNRESDGGLSDRVFVSYHSNAGGGRGVLGLHNGNNRASAATPNQVLLAESLAREINDDLLAQNGQFEHNWSARGDVTLDRTDIEFGEINNERIGGEFDATIMETGFHDDPLDAELLRDPKVRDAIARATYQGLLDYFTAVDSGATSTTRLPGVVSEVRSEATGVGAVTLSWSPPAENAYAGGTPSGYTIYASTNGYGFDGGTAVAGGATTTYTLTDLDPSQKYYFTVVAQNAGGESGRSEVVASAPTGGDTRVLIVNGFDRLDRTLNPTQPYLGGGVAERVRPRQSNSYDYAVQMADAIHGASPAIAIDTAANETVASGDVDLTDYDAVFWILGEQSSADDTLSDIEQNAVQQYLASGGDLFLSGAEVGWDLDQLNNGRAFYNDTLHAGYVSDDADTYQVQGAAGSIFDGLSFAFDDGTQFYDAQFPDVIQPQAGGQGALDYGNGAGAAGVQFDDGGRQLVMFAFPFETITSAAARTEIMERVLDYFEVDAPDPPKVTLTRVLDNDDGPAVYDDVGTWITSSNPDGEGTHRFSLVGFEAAAEWSADVPVGGVAVVSVRYAADSDRTTGAAFEVEAGGQRATASVDQTASDLEWVPIATLPVEAGPVTVRLNVGESTGAKYSLVIADAVRVAVTTHASGDFNADGQVDARDYAVWRATLGQDVAPGAGADANYDGRVDAVDYGVWRQDYAYRAALGARAAERSVSAVAESVIGEAGVPKPSIVPWWPTRPLKSPGDQTDPIREPIISHNAYRTDVLLVAAPTRSAVSMLRIPDLDCERPGATLEPLDWAFEQFSFERNGSADPSSAPA